MNNAFEILSCITMIAAFAAPRFPWWLRWAGLLLCIGGAFRWGLASIAFFSMHVPMMGVFMGCFVLAAVASRASLSPLRGALALTGSEICLTLFDCTALTVCSWSPEMSSHELRLAVIRAIDLTIRHSDRVLV
jgi:hypothetical protein